MPALHDEVEANFSSWLRVFVFFLLRLQRGMVHLGSHGGHLHAFRSPHCYLLHAAASPVSRTLAANQARFLTVTVLNIINLSVDRFCTKELVRISTTESLTLEASSNVSPKKRKESREENCRTEERKQINITLYPKGFLQ